MEELSRVGVAAGITAYVLIVAWLSRRIALDMDERGYDGWLYGLGAFIAPPLGLFAWLLDRQRLPDERGLSSGGFLLVAVAVLVTFPWGLLLWLLFRQRPARS